MTPTEHYKSGQLQAAIDGQLQAVKADPSDQGKRLFLFELCSFAGDWERARKQIAAIDYPEPDRQLLVSSYQKLLDAEEHRNRVFSQGVMPEFLIPPPEWMFTRLQGVAALAQGNVTQASEYFAQADVATPHVAATVNGNAVEEIRDCDDVFGPVLEVLVNGVYYWVPLEQVDSMTANPPKYPRDLYWMPVRLTMKDGPSGDAFVSVLYHGSTKLEDDNLRLGRGTDWSESEPVRGSGLRLMLVGEDAIPITGLLEFQSSESQSDNLDTTE